MFVLSTCESLVCRRYLPDAASGIGVRESCGLSPVEGCELSPLSDLHFAHVHVMLTKCTSPLSSLRPDQMSSSSLFPTPNKLVTSAVVNSLSVVSCFVDSDSVFFHALQDNAIGQRLQNVVRQRFVLHLVTFLCHLSPCKRCFIDFLLGQFSFRAAISNSATTLGRNERCNQISACGESCRSDGN